MFVVAREMFWPKGGGRLGVDPIAFNCIILLIGGPQNIVLYQVSLVFLCRRIVLACPLYTIGKLESERIFDICSTTISAQPRVTSFSCHIIFVFRELHKTF